jgi:hypothetical protein
MQKKHLLSFNAEKKKNLNQAHKKEKLQYLEDFQVSHFEPKEDQQVSSMKFLPLQLRMDSEHQHN